MKVGPFSSFANMGFYQNRAQSLHQSDLTKGNHTFFAGGGYSYTQLNIENNRNGMEQIKAKNFENFLEGAVQSSNVLETIDPTTGKNNADRYYRTNEIDGYLQDKWQMMPNLSITARRPLRLSRRHDGKIRQHVQLRSQAVQRHRHHGTHRL